MKTAQSAICTTGGGTKCPQLVILTNLRGEGKMTT